MGAKVIVLLGLFLAMTLVVCSEVAAARELAETTNAVDPSKESAMIDDDPPTYGPTPYFGTPIGPGGDCSYGCCGESFNGGCRCCAYAGQKMDVGPKN